MNLDAGSGRATVTERRRIVVCLIGGVVTAGAIAAFVVWQLVVLVGWSVPRSNIGREAAPVG